MENRTLYAYRPDYALYPGEYLAEVLASRNIKKNELAQRLSISEKHLSQIINGHVGLTSTLALQLEKALGISANIWNNLNATYELFAARQQDQALLKKNTEWLKNFPINNLKKLGYLPDTRDNLELNEALLAFFGVAGIQQWTSFYNKKAVSFRKSPTFSDDLAHVATWLRVGEKLAEQFDTEPFNKNLFNESLHQIRDLTCKKAEQFESKMKKLCADSGVALVFVSEFKNTHISGAACWVSSDKALIIMSLRYKTNDHFWFTFFHEAAHILKHDKKSIFIDTKDIYNSVKEKEADTFARNIMIPENEYKEFVKLGNFYAETIKDFADSINIHPAIVVGRLQHDKHIEFKWHNGLKEKFELV